MIEVRPPTWHPGHILSDGDHVRADPVEEVVGQHQVNVSLSVCVESEVLLIVPRKALAQSPAVAITQVRSLAAISPRFLYHNF